MTILLTTSNWAVTRWREALKARAPERTVVTHGIDAYDPAAVQYALTWHPPDGLLQGLPNLKAVFNLGAGVDAILSARTVPDVPIVRLVDPNLSQRMTEWVTLQVLTHHRQALAYLGQQHNRQWRERPQPIAGDVRVGLMGYGVLAADAARVLLSLGFQVHAWARSEKATDVTLYVGSEGRAPFLASTDILVVLLPLTPQTAGILDAGLIDALARDGPFGAPVLINAGRGGLQNERDLLNALVDGRLAGASLDVFQTEPLPAEDPLWHAPNLVVTPHCAAVTDPGTAIGIILDQIRAFEAGHGLRHVVDRARGY